MKRKIDPSIILECRKSYYNGSVEDDMQDIRESPYREYMGVLKHYGDSIGYGATQDTLIKMWWRQWLDKQEKPLSTPLSRMADYVVDYFSKLPPSQVSDLTAVVDQIGYDVACHMLQVMWASNLHQWDMHTIGALRYHLPDESTLK